MRASAPPYPVLAVLGALRVTAVFAAGGVPGLVTPVGRVVDVGVLAT